MTHNLWIRPFSAEQIAAAHGLDLLRVDGANVSPPSTAPTPREPPSAVDELLAASRELRPPPRPQSARAAPAPARAPSPTRSPPQSPRPRHPCGYRLDVCGARINPAGFPSRGGLVSRVGAPIRP